MVIFRRADMAVRGRGVFYQVRPMEIRTAGRTASAVQRYSQLSCRPIVCDRYRLLIADIAADIAAGTAVRIQ